MDGKFTFVDQRVCGILGYSPSELLAKSCFEFLHPDDQSHMEDTFKEGKLCPCAPLAFTGNATR